MSAAIFIFLLLELLAISWLDLKNRKISNLWPLANILIFILFAAFYPGLYSLEWELFRIPLLFFGLGYGLYLFGIMGAGDVKYLTTYFLLIPPIFHQTAFFCLLYTTMIVGFVLLVLRGAKNFDKIILVALLREGKFFKGIWGEKVAYSPIVLVSYVWLGIETF